MLNIEGMEIPLEFISLLLERLLITFYNNGAILSEQFGFLFLKRANSYIVIFTSILVGGLKHIKVN